MKRLPFLYHKTCKAENESRGHPLKCQEHWQDRGRGLYICPACGYGWMIEDGVDNPDPENLA